MSKAKFFKMAAAAGIEVDYTPGGIDKWTRERVSYQCMCDAPHGKLFAGLELHSTGEIQGPSGETKTDWKEACNALAELIAKGFEDCTDPDCEICHPDEEE